MHFNEYVNFNFCLTVDNYDYFLLAYQNDRFIKSFRYRSQSNWRNALEDIVKHSIDGMHVLYLHDEKLLIPAGMSIEELVINFELHRCSKAI